MRYEKNLYCCDVFQDPLCEHDDLFSYIKELLSRNSSLADSVSNGSCDGKFVSDDSTSGRRHRTMKSNLGFLNSGQAVYAFVTPFVILIGIIGNSISLRVFCSPRMRKMSASIYLASLALYLCLPGQHGYI